MVLSIRSDLVRHLADPAYAELTAAIRGRATIRAPATPEAVTATIADRTVTLAHGAADGVQVVATLGPAGRRALLSADAKANYPELSDWLTRLLAPSDDWSGAAERFWAALEPLPGAPRPCSSPSSTAASSDASAARAARTSCTGGPRT